MSETLGCEDCTVAKLFDALKSDDSISSGERTEDRERICTGLVRAISSLYDVDVDCGVAGYMTVVKIGTDRQVKQMKNAKEAVLDRVLELITPDVIE